MMVRGVERAVKTPDDAREILRMTDGEFMVWLRGKGEEDVVNGLLHRRLYKMAWGLTSEDVGEDTQKIFKKMLKDNKLMEMEKELALRSGGQVGDVIVDIPEKSLLLSEPRIRRTDINVVDKKGRVKPLSKHSPIADAIGRRMVSPWAILVLCKPELRTKVQSKAKTMFEV
ncbi:MAG TPA: hypothetical protein ENN76_00525 [Euryarchaeota archaeon]|nr:hypothetical protein [Euryarchaeota archaeon]